METHQINLKLPDNLFHAAKSYAENFGFRNMQELAMESMREKVFEENEYDETFTKGEIEFIDNAIEKALKEERIPADRIFKGLRK